MPVFLTFKPNYSCEKGTLNGKSNTDFNGTFSNQCHQNCTNYIFDNSTFGAEFEKISTFKVKKSIDFDYDPFGQSESRILNFDFRPIRIPDFKF